MAVEGTTVIAVALMLTDDRLRRRPSPLPFIVLPVRADTAVPALRHLMRPRASERPCNNGCIDKSLMARSRLGGTGKPLTDAPSDPPLVARPSNGDRPGAATFRLASGRLVALQADDRR